MPIRTMRRAAQMAAFLAVAACHVCGQPSSNVRSAPVPRYALDIRLRPAEHFMHVAGWVELRPLSALQTAIRFSLDSAAANVRFEQPISGDKKAFTVTSHEGGDGNTEWTLQPRLPLASHNNFRIRFSYDLDKQLGKLFYLGPEIALASAWGTNQYPVVLDSDKGIGTLQITCPAKWTAVAGDLPLHAREEEKQGIFKSRVSHPTYSSFAAGPFTIVQGGGSPPISAYVLQQHEYLRALMEGSRRILTAEVDEFGSFPFRRFSLVEVPRDIAQKAGFNAASLPGYIWLNSNAFKAPKVDYMLEWLGHEFSHQWFPQQVALRTPPALYMEEAIAEFGGWHVVEVIGGKAEAEQLRRSGFPYDPIYSAAAYFRLVNAGVDRPLSQLQKGLNDRNLAYNKGAFVFYMLAQVIGDDELRAAFHEIARRYAFQNIDWGTFLRTVEESSGSKLGWFYAQWFDRAGAPEFELSWQQRGTHISGKITQAPPF